MSDPRTTPETDDVDATFATLVGQVDARTRAPGAERAIRDGRAATGGYAGAAILALAVVVLVVVVGGWGLRLGGSGDLSGPVAPPSAGPASGATPAPDVPAPGLLTLDRLNAASTGWVTWEAGTADVVDVPTCDTKSLVLPDSVGDGRIDHYRVGDRVDAWLESNRYRSVADANLAMRAFVENYEACPEQAALYNHDFSAELELVAFTWGTGPRRGGGWLINHGDRVDVFRFFGAPQPSVDVQQEVGRVLAADVQVP